MDQNGFGQLEEKKSSVKPTDNIDQVREILFGEQKRCLDAQVHDLDKRVARLEEKFLEFKKETMEKLEASEIAHQASQREVVFNIADSIKQLGDQINQFYKKQNGEPSHESTE